MKSSLVLLTGRPSVGKSSMMNLICRRPISITTPIPQTTRNRIRGIYNDERGQLVFLDTPGLHRDERGFNAGLRALVTESVDSVDSILYLVDATRPPGEEEQDVVDLIATAEVPVLVAINKIDAAKKDAIASMRGFVESRLVGRTIVETSVNARVGIEELLALLFDVAPEGPAMYPADMSTDQSIEMRVAEAIREQAMLVGRDELPHAVYAHVEEIHHHEASVDIRAVVFVERESQKGMLVGKGGATIHKIRAGAVRRLKKLFGAPVQIDLRIKVDRDWRRNKARIDRLIH